MNERKVKKHVFWNIYKSFFNTYAKMSGFASG